MGTLTKATNGVGEGGSRVYIGRGWGHKPPLIPTQLLMQLHITNMYSVRIGVLYLSCETSQWNTYNHKHSDETK